MSDLAGLIAARSLLVINGSRDQLLLFSVPLRAIRENLDVTAHMDDAVNSLRIVPAADKSVRAAQVDTLSDVSISERVEAAPAS
jgi:hypothetical protein